MASLAVPEVGSGSSSRPPLEQALASSNAPKQVPANPANFNIINPSLLTRTPRTGVTKGLCTIHLAGTFS
jgi:hypothetical protein